MGEKAVNIPNLSSLFAKIKNIYGNILGAGRKMSSGASSFGEAGKSCRNNDCDKASGSDSIGINNVESDNRNTNKKTVKLSPLCNDEIVNGENLAIPLMAIEEVAEFESSCHGLSPLKEFRPEIQLVASGGEVSGKRFTPHIIKTLLAITSVLNSVPNLNDLRSGFMYDL
ncbi:hypothetical protein Tco_0254898 [Tanacetum coccineum]